MATQFNDGNVTIDFVDSFSELDGNIAATQIPNDLITPAMLGVSGNNFITEIGADVNIATQTQAILNSAGALDTSANTFFLSATALGATATRTIYGAGQTAVGTNFEAVSGSTSEGEIQFDGATSIRIRFTAAEYATAQMAIVADTTIEVSDGTDTIFFDVTSVVNQDANRRLVITGAYHSDGGGSQTTISAGTDMLTIRVGATSSVYNTITRRTTNAEIGYLVGTRSNLQKQIDDLNEGGISAIDTVARNSAQSALMAANDAQNTADDAYAAANAAHAEANLRATTTSVTAVNTLATAANNLATSANTLATNANNRATSAQTEAAAANTTANAANAAINLLTPTEIGDQAFSNPPADLDPTEQGNVRNAIGITSTDVISGSLPQVVANATVTAGAVLVNATSDITISEAPQAGSYVTRGTGGDADKLVFTNAGTYRLYGSITFTGNDRTGPSFSVDGTGIEVIGWSHAYSRDADSSHTVLRTIDFTVSQDGAIGTLQVINRQIAQSDGTFGTQTLTLASVGDLRIQPIAGTKGDAGNAGEYDDTDRLDAAFIAGGGVTNAQFDALSSLATEQTAQNTAIEAANTLAGAANTLATSANTLATTANTTATTALANADAAQGTADTALANAATNATAIDGLAAFSDSITPTAIGSYRRGADYSNPGILNITGTGNSSTLVMTNTDQGSTNRAGILGNIEAGHTIRVDLETLFIVATATANNNNTYTFTGTLALGDPTSPSDSANNMVSYYEFSWTNVRDLVYLAVKSMAI